jgi:hypothetical protein
VNKPLKRSEESMLQIPPLGAPTISVFCTGK